MDYKKLKTNPSNPRRIDKKQFERLKESIGSFTKMLEIRPIAYDEDGIIWGGNMRYLALKELGVEMKPEYFKELTGYTLEEKREFAIRDNIELGEWDDDVLANEWSDLPLEDWGIDIGISETERLSELRFEDIYYTPKNIPNVKLTDCLNMDKFNAKVGAIEESNLTREQKDILRNFAYRFIKIDFENVANYYFFNTGDEEKRVMERLRLVLCDEGIDGFIEDDLLRIHNQLEGWGDD